MGCDNLNSGTTGGGEVNTPTAVSFKTLTANGASGTTTTTVLTLTFDKDPTGLTAQNITVTGATKGALTGNGTTRTLGISNITKNNGKKVTVTLTNPTGLSISPSSLDVMVWERVENLASAGITFEGKTYAETGEVWVIPSGTVTITGNAANGGGVFVAGRTVTLSAYKMGQYQVTQELYLAVMGLAEADNPSYFKNSPDGEELQHLRPVERVNWYHAIAFCNKLSLKVGLDPAYSVKQEGNSNEIDWSALVFDSIPTASKDNWNAATLDKTKNGYRLPTEAQWEFAARGGNTANTTNWAYPYAGSDTITGVAWYGNKTENANTADGKTHEVGKKTKNALNLYDMSGNVCEWCWDWYNATATANDENYEIDGKVTDPMGAASGSSRVGRGGSWFFDASSCTVANRGSGNPSGRSIFIGIRVVRP